MKKALYLLLFAVGSANAQIVTIPDANFKSLLLASNATIGVAGGTNFQPMIVDTNQDGEIQYSEAANVYFIDVLGAGINSLDGIEAFTSLGWLRCTNNNLTSVDFSSNTNLVKLQIGENQLTSLDVSMLTNLDWLVCNNNLLTSLNVLPLTNLEDLSCHFNQLTSIDVSTLSNIYTLNLSNNQLTSIDLNGAEGVVQLNLQNNQLSSIDLSMLTQVEALYLNDNNLTTIDISNLETVSVVGVSNNQLTTLDASQNTNLTVLLCSNNNLESLFVKNGRDEVNFDNQYVFSNNPALTFICADEFQVESIQNSLSALGNTSTVVNSYCTFIPGGNYNTINGAVSFDNNSNGCDVNDQLEPNIRLNINDGTNQGATFTNAAGIYNFYTLAGNFTVQPVLENPSFFVLTPGNVTIPFADTNYNTTTQNFCISPNGSHQDLEIVIAPIVPARPGFQATYEITYKNKGNTILPSTSNGLYLEYDADKMQLVSASEPITGTGANFVNFGYETLHPFETRTITVFFLINTPTEANPVNIDDVLTFTAQISPNNNDEYVFDNQFILNQIVVGSFDPNDIRCLQGETVPPSEIGNYLHYIVNFENTGNYYAENVVVKLDIDASKYDISTLQLLNTSHPSYTQITNNRVEFMFEGINLDAAGGNPPVGGHGNVLFKIRSKEDLGDGDYVSKRANIYFDYNAPIDTNIAFTTFQTLSNSISQFDDSISVSPNPTHGNVNINSKFNIKIIELYDVQGRILETVIENSNESILDVSKRQSGIYFLKITTDEGSKVEKIVKE